jgi:hypothetical protein
LNRQEKENDKTRKKAGKGIWTGKGIGQKK